MPDELAPELDSTLKMPFEPLSATELREAVLNRKEPPIVIELDGSGPVRMRVATGRDVLFLTDLVHRESEPRAFAEAVLRHQLEEGAFDDAVVGELPDAQLAQLVGAWAAHSLTTVTEAPTTLSDVRSTLQGDVERREAEMATLLARIRLPVMPSLGIHFQPAIQSLVESSRRITESIRPHLEILTQQLSEPRRLVESFAHVSIPPAALTQIFESIPSPERVRELLQGLREGQETLDELGYGFTIEAWEPGFIQQIGRGEYGHRELHNLLLAETRTSEYREQLASTFGQTERLGQRWKIVGPALNAHVRREYALSIPAFLTQLEGMATDLLILKGRAVFQGKKLLAKEEGAVKRQKRRPGKAVVLSGLDAKLRHSGYERMEEVRDAADFILNSLVHLRNAILHGSRTSYMSAKLSVQLLHLIGTYAQVAVNEERKGLT